MENHINWLDSIYSDGSKIFLSNNNPKLNDKVTIGIRMFKDSQMDEVYLRYLRNGEETICKMEKSYEKGDFIYYSYEILISQPFINYYFIVSSQGHTYFYNQLGVFEEIITEDYDFKIVADFNYPQWVDGSVFYEIFPDRFFNGNEENDVKDGEYSYGDFHTSKIPWNQKVGTYNQYGCLDFYGGDLDGIEQKIQYLKELGVTAVYVTPIFEAPSHHKYDCSDYFNVDKHFGGNQALTKLVKRLHEEGMKLIVDISINHTGDTNKWTKENKEFYFVKENGELEGWNGVKSLPVLNYSNEDLKNRVYRDETSALKKWLQKPYEIDGWRLDVGHNVGKMNAVQEDKKIWKELRIELKNLKKDSYIIAEHWTDCSSYLQGDMWDGTMNYFGFFRPVRRYLGENDAFLKWKISDIKMIKNNGTIFKKEVMSHYGKLPYQLQNLQLNLFSSHDIYRLHNSPYLTKENIRTAIVMLLTFKGTPCIYYGDEVGLEGEIDRAEGCRYPMQWDENKWDKELFNLYKKMIKIRNTEEVVSKGSFRILLDEERALSYARFDDKEAVIFVNSQYDCEKELELPIKLLGSVKDINIIHGEDKKLSCIDSMLKIRLKPQETTLIKVNLE